jgi:LysM repeat protein
VRNPLPLLLLLALPFKGAAQVPEDSGDQGGGAIAPRAQPAEAQDAEAARERLLKAADQLDLIQSNAETARVAMEQMKSDLAQLQASNADLKQQVVALQAAFDKSEAARAKERQVLLNEVAQVMAIKSSSHPHPDQSELTSSDPGTAGDTDTEVHHPKTKTTDTDTTEPAASSKPKSHKGYVHVVESGETLTMICAAYRADGVKVSVSEVRRANGLTSKSSLKVGQKLFIPQPGT